MKEYKNGCGCEDNVSCRVTDCVYHNTENRCCATHITVENERAQKSAETFCGTFKCRGGSC